MSCSAVRSTVRLGPVRRYHAAVCHGALVRMGATICRPGCQRPSLGQPKPVTSVNPSTMLPGRPRTGSAVAAVLLCIVVVLAQLLCDAHAVITGSILPAELRKVVDIRDTRHGTVMYLPNDVPIGTALQLYGQWSYDETLLFEQILRPGDVVVDAGANIGLFSLDFARFVGPTGSVYSFEAHPFIYEMLAGNAALNAATNIRAVNAALGDGTTSSIIVPPLDFSKAQCFACLSLGSHTEGYSVPMTTIDALGLSAVRLMKVDVEGMELEVLRGAQHTLAQHQPLLYVENNRDAKSPAVVRLLDALQYDCHWHMAPCYAPDRNYYGSTHREDVSPMSVNMLCVPRAQRWQLSGFEPVRVPADGDDARWLAEHRFF